jgi:hypothetical protein
MRTTTLAVFALALLLPAFLRADETWAGSSDVTFKGYSTLHDFEGTLKKVPLKATVAGAKDTRVVSASSRVEVKQMSTQNEKRDRGMMAMLNETAHHFISLQVERADERTLHPRSGAGRMPITLTIAGHSGRVTGTVTNVVEQPENVAFDLAFPVSLKAFQLEPPSAMVGLVKVKDTVDVTAHVTLRKESR